MPEKRLAIKQMLHTTLEVLEQEVSPMWIAQTVSDLEQFPLDVVALALRRCRLELHKVAPTDIIQRLGIPIGEDAETAKATLAWMSVARHLWCCSGACGCEYYHWSDKARAEFETTADERTKHAFHVAGGWARLGATEIKHVAFVQRDFMDAYKRYEQVEMVRLALPEEVKPDFKRLTEKSAMLPARQISEQVYAEPLAPGPRSAVVNTKEQLREQIEEIRANRGDATRVLTAKATACRPITARTPTVSQFLCQPKTTRADRRR